MELWIVSLSHFLHISATVVWIGGIFMILLVILPGSKTALESPLVGKLMKEIGQRFTPLANMSILILIKGVERHRLTYAYSSTHTVNSAFSPLFFVPGNEREMLIRWFYGFYDPLRVNPESALMG